MNDTHSKGDGYLLIVDDIASLIRELIATVAEDAGYAY